MVIIQFTKYVVIGLASNGLLYFLYLVMTKYGIGHKSAMTLLYVTGVLQTFMFNKKWTFSHQGGVSKSLFRYLASYALGYMLNFFALFYFVDKLFFSHEVVQGIMIILNAMMLFMLQKFWVFKVECTEEQEIRSKNITKTSRSRRRGKKKSRAFKRRLAK